MAFEFTHDRKKYFDFQYHNAADSIVPFVKTNISFGSSCRVLEIGCCDGGVLKAFTDLDCVTVGVDIHAPMIEDAKINMHKEIEAGKASFFAKDIYQVDPEKDFEAKFDLVILKDVIEHIPNQQNLMHELHRFLRKDGIIFLGFPPWQMPFGGHQQGSENFILSRLPWYHLLPKTIYRKLFELTGESSQMINYLMDVKNSGISIERFEKILGQTSWQTLQKTFYLINPIYSYKFGLKTRGLWQPLTGILFLRNFFITAVYYLIKPD